MNELLQLPDVTIISDDNRINLYFPLIVSPGCWLPAAVLGDDPGGEKGKLREFPSFPLAGFLWGKRAELTLAFVGFRADLWQVRRESWSTLEPGPRRSPKLLSGASKRSFAVQNKGNLPALL